MPELQCRNGVCRKLKKGQPRKQALRNIKMNNENVGSLMNGTGNLVTVGIDKAEVQHALFNSLSTRKVSHVSVFRGRL